MKRCLSILLALMLALCLTVSAAEEAEEWVCPSCEKTSTGNFCSNCGAKKPDSDGAGGAEGGTCRLSLSIAFEENLMFSTYDVSMLIDGTVIATMPHGQGYSGTVDLEPGRHTLEFQRSGKASVNGVYTFNLHGDASLSCEIHAKNNQVKITDAKIEEKAVSGAGDETDGRMAAPADQTVIRVNGDIRLDLSVEFEENLMFSTYDVQLFVDDELVATLPHGEDYAAVLGVSEGLHILKFQKVGKASVKGVSQISVSEDTSFSCKIQAKNSEVKVSKEKLGNAYSSMSKEDFAAACVTVPYRDVERNPDQNKGLKIRVSGTVIQVEEGWFDTVTLRVRDAGGDVWYVTYTRADGESRILENDSITVYGTCEGVETYTSVLGTSVTIPAVRARYIDAE